MKEKDINILLQKAEELKALFTFGQRVIPFLEEIFIFVRDIKPLLDEINSSIEENLKKMPTASKQLSKVTEATEVATTEIMDIVDGLFFKSDVISNNLNKISLIEQERRNNPVKILEIIQNALNKETDIQELLPQLTKAIQHLRGKSNKDYEEITNHTNKLLQSIRDDSSSIMMSLQVQDITSQQIAAVNHLLETVQKKLTEILSHFQSTELSGLIIEHDKYSERTNVSTLHREIAFDPDAVDSLKPHGSRQTDVDNLILQHESGLLNTHTNQENTKIDIEPEIIHNNKEDISSIKNIISETNDDYSTEEFSQDDIDALFSDTK
jgi:chemotaxis regulatin CheY-phosphate phosphatase CheZ